MAEERHAYTQDRIAASRAADVARRNQHRPTTPWNGHMTDQMTSADARVASPFEQRSSQPKRQQPYKQHGSHVKYDRQAPTTPDKAGFWDSQAQVSPGRAAFKAAASTSPNTAYTKPAATAYDEYEDGAVQGDQQQKQRSRRHSKQHQSKNALKRLLDKLHIDATKLQQEREVRCRRGRQGKPCKKSKVGKQCVSLNNTAECRRCSRNIGSSAGIA